MEVKMRKAQFLAVFWTLFLAVPITALALSLAAYLTDHLVEISLAMQNVGESVRGTNTWLVFLGERWPEVAGMIVGQLVIMIILLLVRKNNGAEEKSTNR
jgi:hypothetical protein